MQTIIETKITNIDNSGNKSVRTITKSFNSLNEVEKRSIDIAADGTVNIWDPTNDSGDTTQDFTYLILKSDGDLDVEMTINEGHANEELNSFRLAAGTPFILGSDVAYYDHSASDIYAGTLDVIDKIRVDEPNSAAVKLELEMGR